MLVSYSRLPLAYGALLAVIVSLSSLTNVVDCKTVSGPGEPVLIPLVPENRTLTRLIERQLAGKARSASRVDCTTNEDEAPMIGQTRNGIIGSRYRWTDFKVYPDPSYNANERQLIQNAMVRLKSALPCVRFTLWGSRPSGDYVHIKKLSGCYSAIGKRGGAQDLSLQSPGCMYVGTIMHEMIHALGFWHEQSRPDRDDYVTVNWGNIQAGQEHNFQKLASSQATTFGVPYNTRSIMHYGPTAFSKNGRPTIQSKRGGTVGDTGDLQSTDIQKLKRMYNC